MFIKEGGSRVFKVIFHFDGHSCMDARASYIEALTSFTAWNKAALKLQIAGIINEYYVELVKEEHK